MFYVVINGKIKQGRADLNTTRRLVDKVYEHYYGEKWYREDEDKVPELINLLQKAEKTVKIVVGEINPENFERDKVINNFRYLLDKGVSISIVCHKAREKTFAVELFIKENPKLLILKKHFPEKLTLYWQKCRATVHFCVVDDRHIRLDTPHEPYRGREAMFMYDTESLAKGWSEKFDKLIENECKEIKDEDIESAEARLPKQK